MKTCIRKGFKGKVIKQVEFCDGASKLVILFDDDTYMVFGVEQCGDSTDISIMSELDIDDYEKRTLGIISQNEYDELKRLEKEKIVEYRRGLYQQLKREFE